MLFVIYSKYIQRRCARYKNDVNLFGLKCKISTQFVQNGFVSVRAKVKRAHMEQRYWISVFRASWSSWLAHHQFERSHVQYFRVARYKYPPPNVDHKGERRPVCNYPRYCLSRQCHRNSGKMVKIRSPFAEGRW